MLIGDLPIQNIIELPCMRMRIILNVSICHIQVILLN